MKHKRWLSLLLVFCMLFCLTAVTAFAEDLDEDDLIAIVEEPEEIETVSAPVTAGEPELWVYGVQVTEANASDILGDGKVSYDFATNTLTFTGTPTATALHNDALIDAANMDLTIVTANSVSFSSKTARFGVQVTGGSLTVNGNLTVALTNSAADTCVYAENGLTVNGNLDVDSYNTKDGFGVKTINNGVTVTGYAAAFAHETGIYCGNGDVVISGDTYFMIDSEATLGFCPSSCIYAANGGVDVKSFSLEMGVASQLIYANGPIHIRSAVTVENTGGQAGGSCFISTEGGIVIDGNAKLTARNGICLNSGDAPEGILIKGNAELKNTANANLVKANGGPFTVAGYLKADGLGDCVISAKGDITVGKYVTISASYYSIHHDEFASAMRSTDGSINVTGNLTCSSTDKCVYAKNDITVGGDALLSFAGADDSQTVDYGMKAETGSINVAGKLEVLGKALVSIYAGEDFTAAQNVTVTNAEATSVGMDVLGTAAFVSGKWDVTAGTTGIRAAEGIVIPAGYGVTLPAGGRAVLLDGVYTVTEADKTTVAAHVIISDEVTLEDGFYLMRPDWTAFAINPAEVFETNPENTNEYMLSTTLNVGDEIKVVRVENGAVTGWWPDGEGTQYTVDEAHAGAKTVYFKTSYDSAWSEFGGYFYIEGTAAPTGYHINVTDYTKGVAVTSIETETLYTGEVTFTVSSGADDKAVGVAVLNADGTLTRLACTTADGVHSFTVTVEDADVTVVLIFKGDFDLNGRVQSKDSTLLKQTLVGLKELDPETAALQIFAVDLNNDGKIQNKEGTMISQVLVDNSSYAW